VLVALVYVSLALRRRINQDATQFPTSVEPSVP
jgi:hypothetical protein